MRPRRRLRTPECSPISRRFQGGARRWQNEPIRDLDAAIRTFVPQPVADVRSLIVNVCFAGRTQPVDANR